MLANILMMIIIENQDRPIKTINLQFEANIKILQNELHVFSIRNLAQCPVPKVPYVWTSNNQIVVLKVP